MTVSIAPMSTLVSVPASATEPEAAPVSLRIRVQTDEGVFLVYDAMIPPDNPRDQAGYLAYWSDVESQRVYFYTGLLQSDADVGQAMLALERDLLIDLGGITEFSPTLAWRLDQALISVPDRGTTRGGETKPNRSRSRNESPITSATAWQPLTYSAAMAAMGYDVDVGSVAVRPPPESGEVPCDPPPTNATKPRPRGNIPDRSSGIRRAVALPAPTATTPRQLITQAAVVIGCIIDDGGTPPPPPPPPPCICCLFGGAAAVTDPPCCDPAPGGCDDGDPCTEQDKCQFWPPGTTFANFECHGVPKKCDDGDNCTRDTCDSLTGACGHNPECSAAETCCTANPGWFCCPGTAALCCDNPLHCCPAGNTCCGAGCCTPDEECIQGHCCPIGNVWCGDECCTSSTLCCAGACCDDGDPCTDDSCEVVNGSVLGCVNTPKCDDGDECTTDGCTAGTCWHEPRCEPGNCCTNGVCCSFPCNECIDHGMLSPGLIVVSPDPPCPGQTITFTLAGVTDGGGMQRINCVTTAISPGTVTYVWILTIPPDYPPPLPPLTGTGSTVAVVAKASGGYGVTFVASVDRECPPPSLMIQGLFVVAPPSCSVQHAAAEGCPGSTVALDCVATNTSLCPETYTWTAQQVGGLPTIAPSSGTMTLAPGQTINQPVNLPIAANSAAGLAQVQVALTAEGATAPTCSDIATVTVTASEVLLDMSISQGLLKTDPIRATLDSVPNLSVTTFDVTAGGSYVQSTSCCSDGVLTTKHHMDGSLTLSVKLKMTLPGFSGAASVSVPGVGAAGVGYNLGPFVKAELGGAQIAVGGDYIEQPCPDGCISWTFAVPFNFSAGVEFSVVLEAVDTAGVTVWSLNASVQLAVNVNGVQVSGGGAALGDGCQPAQAVKVTAAAVTVTPTIALTYTNLDGDLTNWEMTLAERVIFEGISFP